MITHTPAPWTIDAGMSNLVHLINGPDGAVGEVVYAETRNPADAKLIAAAPELLAALKQAFEHINGGSGIKQGMEWKAMYVQIRAAIAKAEGGAA